MAKLMHLVDVAHTEQNKAFDGVGWTVPFEWDLAYVGDYLVFWKREFRQWRDKVEKKRLAMDENNRSEDEKIEMARKRIKEEGLVKVVEPHHHFPQTPQTPPDEGFHCKPCAEGLTCEREWTCMCSFFGCTPVYVPRDGYKDRREQMEKKERQLELEQSMKEVLQKMEDRAHELAQRQEKKYADYEKINQEKQELQKQCQQLVTDIAVLEERCAGYEKTIQGMDQDINNLKYNHEKTIRIMGQEKMELHVDKAMLEERCAGYEKSIQSMDQDINTLKHNHEKTICIMGQEKMDLHVGKAILEERCAGYEKRIERCDQENKSLKGELADIRSKSHWGNVENAASECLSTSWINVRGPGAADATSDDGGSWLSVNTAETHCWMSDAVFKKVENDKEFFVEGRELEKGSLVRAADGKSTLKVADAPERHETNIVIVLDAGGATLRLTPKHRVSVLTDGQKKEIQAKDLQKGDLVFVNSVPTKLTSVTEMPLHKETLQIRFVPDEAVAVYTVAPSIESKGHKKKALRRSGMNKRGQSNGIVNDIKTEGYYTD